MEEQLVTSKQYFSTLSIIHLALLMGLVLFAGVAYYLLVSGNFIPDSGLNDSFQLAVPIVLVGSLLAGVYIYRMRLQAIRSHSTLKEKLGAYQGAVLVHWVLFEAPAFFALVAFLLTNNYLFLGLAAFPILLLALANPSKEKAANDLELNLSETAVLNDPNAIVAAYNKESE